MVARDKSVFTLAHEARLKLRDGLEFYERRRIALGFKVR
jgi:hypothetical protein